MGKHKNRPLSHKQENFCQAYVLNGGNGTQAAITAKYSQKSASSTASTLLKVPKVAERIEHLRDQLTAGVRKKFELTGEQFGEELLKILDQLPKGAPTWAERTAALKLYAQFAGLIGPDTHIQNNLSFKEFREEVMRGSGQTLSGPSKMPH